ncbi:uncharacterized protein LOC132272937 [Cornus florida]|uniref:uncharacterized protein LOC132272937 n=1 Tax=Cornus florida TaxID=4283 RepID=UPI0028A06527|nr:uncharacterized protein LOC132272937 [Cornus florida]
MSKKKEEKEHTNLLPDFDDMDDQDEDDGTIIDVKGKRVASGTGSNNIQSKKKKQKGPIDLYFTPPPEQIGTSNVIQVVTDSASSNVVAGRILEGRHRHLYWSPCAAHCVDLMLEDIAKIPKIMMTIKRVIMLNGYIYNRSGLLNMMGVILDIKSCLDLQRLDLPLHLSRYQASIIKRIA